MRSCTQYGDAERKIKASLRLRHVAAFQTGRPVQKVVAGGCFRILIDGDDDRLHMLIAPALSGRETARCFERLQDVGMLSGQWQNKTAPLPAPFLVHQWIMSTSTGSGGSDPLGHCDLDAIRQRGYAAPE
jgi:hypothetical protein